MREDIGLFRGKRLSDCVWVEGYLCVIDGRPFIMTRENVDYAYTKVAAPPYTFDGELTRVDPATVGEYCGLKDKNGKRIFEGDVVRHHNDYPDTEIEEIGHIYWDEGCCAWRRSSNGGFHHGVVGNYSLSRTCVYEKIGNIHDNPELLEV